MKRFLLILLLTGMIMVWAFSPVSQTVQAERSNEVPPRTVYRSAIFTGPISLTAKLTSDYPRLKTKVEWTATGTVFIDFPENNLKKRVKVEFNEFHLIGNRFGLSLPGDVCTDLYYYSRDTFPPFNSYSDYFAGKERLFKLPVKLGMSQLTGWTVAGMCKGDGDPMKGKLTSEYAGYAELMDPIMFYVAGQERQTYLYGSCKLPTWELGTFGENSYTTDCKWDATLQEISQPPEWWMPPEKRKK